MKVTLISKTKGYVKWVGDKKLVFRNGVCVAELTKDELAEIKQDPNVSVKENDSGTANKKA